jgi:hypothetical protein
MFKSTRWYYKFPGNAYAYGPTTQTFANQKKAREHIRKSWELERLPKGFELWRA